MKSCFDTACVLDRSRKAVEQDFQLPFETKEKRITEPWHLCNEVLVCVKEVLLQIHITTKDR